MPRSKLASNFKQSKGYILKVLITSAKAELLTHLGCTIQETEHRTKFISQIFEYNCCRRFLIDYAKVKCDLLSVKSITCGTNIKSGGIPIIRIPEGREVVLSIKFA